MRRRGSPGPDPPTSGGDEREIVGELHRRYASGPGEEVDQWYRNPLVWVTIVSFLYMEIIALLAFVTIVPGWVFLQTRPILFVWGIGGVLFILVGAILYIIYLANAVHASFRHNVEIAAYSVALVLSYVVGLVILWRFEGEFGNPDIKDVYDRLRATGNATPLPSDALVYAEYLTTFLVVAAQFPILLYAFYRVMHAHTHPMATHSYLNASEMAGIEARLTTTQQIKGGV